MFSLKKHCLSQKELNIGCRVSLKSTNIFQNSESGFSLEVIADRMFEKDGTVHMIDFQSLPLRIYDVIVEQGFKILNVSPEDDILKSAEKMVTIDLKLWP